MPLFQLDDPLNPAVPASYSLAPTPPAPCGSGDQQICLINAPNSGGVPTINNALLAEMVTALNTHSNTTNITLKL